MRHLTSAGLLCACALAGSGPRAGAAQPDLLSVSSFGVYLYVAQGNVNGTFDSPETWITGHGDNFSFPVVVGDFNGDGLDDILIEGSKVSIRLNTGANGFAPPVQQPYSYGASSDLPLLAGDFNGDGLSDLADFSGTNGFGGCGPEVLVSLNHNGAFDTVPIAGGARDFLGNFQWMGIADMNGDGRDDLLKMDIQGEVVVALADAAGTFKSPIFFNGAAPGLQYNTTTHFGLLAADFTGDGKADIAQTTPYGDVWVCASTGASLAAPVKWGTLGFLDAYDLTTTSNVYSNYAAFAADINNDGKADILDLTDIGEVWGALSTGTAFGAPEKLGSPGFDHKPLHLPQTVVGNFTNAGEPAKSAK
ncbi:hypothetical protein BH09SUM1_BH09SUM1_00140 [soil metagenome]